jgi:hypothetical protein
MNAYNDSKKLQDQQAGEHWLQISKNFCANPIAYAPRARAVFRRTPDNDYRCWASANIALRIPLDSPKQLRRGPSGYDMKFLYWVLSMRVLRIENRLSMTTKEMLERMGEQCTRWNYANLPRAIDYWQHMGMQFDRFYVPDDKKLKAGSYTSLSLGPPISVLNDGSIAVNDDWEPLVPYTYYKRLPCTLSTEAYVQILTLLVADGRRASTRRFDSKRQLTRLLGINHEHRNEVLDRVIDDTSRWFAQHDGQLTHTVDRDGCLALTAQAKALPKLTRTKKILAERKEREKEYKRSGLY